jgi:predicted nucleotidyltransferase
MNGGSISAPPIDIRPEHWRIILDILQTHIPDYTVWAFGSRVKGAARPYSDLDLALISEEPLPIGVRAALAEALSESDLPWKVDLVDWATISPSFRRIITREHVVVANGARRIEPCGTRSDETAG